MKTILRNCNIIDCTGKNMQSGMTIVIDGNRISTIQKANAPVNGEGESREFDLKGRYVVPGLWNVHVHLSDLLPDPRNLLEGETVGDAAIRSGRNAIEGLKYGFTSLRVVGERDYLDVAWRNAFNDGVFVGPRLFVSGYPITATAGHGWEPIGPCSLQIDGVAGARNAVRENLRHKVDWIKIMDTEMMPDEIQAVVEVAHQRNIKVCAHSGAPMTKVSIKAGVDCIEHAYGIDDDTVALMAEHNTFYVPTLSCNLDEEAITAREERLAKDCFASDEEVVKGRITIAREDERTPEFARVQREGFQKAVKAGVRICPGGDSNPVGELGVLEIEQFVSYGMTEMQALIAATRTSAELCGVDDELGTVECGKLADLVVLSGNPLDNISNLRKVEMVFKDGSPVDIAPKEGVASFWKLFML